MDDFLASEHPMVTVASILDEHQPIVEGRERVDLEEGEQNEPLPCSHDSLFSKDEEISPFFFESKHHKLKENEDYQKLMKLLVQLESQKIQAIKDLETLARVKEEALDDPVAFITSLKEGTLPPLPRPQEVFPVPEIDWSKYDHTSIEGPSGEDRHVEQADLESSGPKDNRSILLKEGMVVIRGRKLEDDKPGSFNQLWTAEEQTKLEYLLQVYPSEKREVRRWEKIAKALGNRTPKQVASRVQKYFIKLAKAGLPVPGRLPKVNVMHSKKPRKRKRTISHARMEAFGRKTTFFATYQPEVYMPDDWEEEEECGSQGTSSGCPSRQEPAEIDDSFDVEAQITEEDGGFVGSLHCGRSDSPLLQSFVDKDYLGFETAGLDVGYNYLDTNFLPGN